MKKITRFFIDLKKEIKKIRWPEKKELFKYSVATVGCVTVLGTFFTILNFIFSALMKAGI